MPRNRWLSDEYIRERLNLAATFAKRFRLEEFKLIFFVPAKDDHILKLARELGFRVSRENKMIILELKQRKRVVGRV